MGGFACDPFHCRVHFVGLWPAERIVAVRRSHVHNSRRLGLVQRFVQQVVHKDRTQGVHLDCFHKAVAGDVVETDRCRHVQQSVDDWMLLQNVGNGAANAGERTEIHRVTVGGNGWPERFAQLGAVGFRLLFCDACGNYGRPVAQGSLRDGSPEPSVGPRDQISLVLQLVAERADVETGRAMERPVVGTAIGGCCPGIRSQSRGQARACSNFH
mmetsp:Transcript_19672/g.28937  ORF Transcript_19672/g.28937 Transcript_19672/m.28937 type:complete len:213 (-) Transcript_19672:95-733(-)